MIIELNQLVHFKHVLAVHLVYVLIMKKMMNNITRENKHGKNIDMKKECFTCAHKRTIELTKEDKKAIREKNIADGRKFKRIPDLEFECRISGNKIDQIDPACKHYQASSFMCEIRECISNTAKELRKEINK